MDAYIYRAALLCADCAVDRMNRIEFANMRWGLLP